MTIPADQVRAVRALYATGLLSQEEVARKVGVSRTSVQSILYGSGRHADSVREPVEAAADPDWQGKPVECPTCHVLVVLPCIACRARQARESAGDTGPDPEPVKLELRPPERRRYRQVRRHGIDPAAADACFGELGAAARIDPRAADEIFRQAGGS